MGGPLTLRTVFRSSKTPHNPSTYGQHDETAYAIRKERKTCEAVGRFRFRVQQLSRFVVVSGGNGTRPRQVGRIMYIPSTTVVVLRTRKTP